MISQNISFMRMTSAIALMFSFSIIANAQADAKAKPKGGSMSSMSAPEMKKDMADMYQKMADCLKTEMSHSDCQKEVMKSCPVAKAMGHCPLMDNMKNMKMGQMKPEMMKGMDNMQKTEH